MIRIYYGHGDGKTSTLNGAALRAKGAGMSVIIYRFLKGWPNSEDSVLISAGIPVKRFHLGAKFVIEMTPTEKATAQKIVAAGLAEVVADAPKYDVVVLDDLLDLAADTVGFATEAALAALVKKLASKTEVLISGYIKLPAVFALADLITHYAPEKHYFEKGVPARRGFEF